MSWRLASSVRWALTMGLLLALGRPILAAEPPQILRLPAPQQTIDLLPYLGALHDPTGQLTIAEVSAPARAADFHPVQDPTFEPTPGGALWLRLWITSEKDHASSRGWLLHLERPYLKSITYYAPRSPGSGSAAASRWVSEHAGFFDSHSLGQNLLFRLPAATAAPQAVYLRLESSWPVVLPLQVCTVEACQRQIQTQLLLSGVFFGIMGFLVVIHLLLWAYLRDLGSLWYVLLLAGVILYSAIDTDLLVPHLSSLGPRGVIALIGLAISLIVVSSGLFSRRFLLTRSTAPLTDKLILLYVLLGCGLALLVLAYPSPWVLHHYAVGLGVLSPVVIIGSGAICWRRGFKPARFYLLAWSFFGVGSFFVALFGAHHWGILAFQAGALLNGLFLTLGLADRLRTLNRERELVEQARQESERRFRAIFEQSFQFIGLTQPDGTILEVNSSATQLAAGTVEELRGKRFWEIPWLAEPQRDVPRLRQAFAQAARGEFVRLELLGRARDGSELNVDFSVKPLVGQDGQVTLLIPEGRDITARVRSEEELRQTHAQLEATLNALPDILFEVDQTGLIYDFRAPHPELLYLPPQEFLGQRYQEVVPPEVARTIGEAICGAAQHGTQTGEVYALQTPHGLGWFEPSVARKGKTTDPDHRYIVLVHDVTDRKQAEHALLRREATLKCLAEMINDLLRVPSWRDRVEKSLRDLGQAAEVSRVYIFENELGQDGDLLTSQRWEWAAADAPAEIDNVALQGLPFAKGGLERWAELMSRGEPVTGVVRDFPASERQVLEPQAIRSLIAVPIFVGERWWGFIGFDDCREERDWSAAEISVLRNAAGMFETLLFRDQAEEALRESENKYRAIFETTGSAMIIFDEEARISLANREFTKLTGYPLEELLGSTSWVKLFTPQSMERMKLYHSKRTSLPHDAPRSYEVTLIDRGGRRHDCIVVVDVISETLERVAGFLDITERKQAEQQMLRADKMAALGQIIAGVAHEINNPNNFIYFNLPILKRYLEALRPLLDHHVEEDPELKILGLPYHDFMEDFLRLVENMQHGSERITGIVGELKSYIRGQEVEEMQPGSLREVIDHVMVLVGKQVQKMVKRFEVQVEEDLPPVMMHAGKLEQVLINLVINAGQAADKADSTIKLTASNSPTSPERVQILVDDNGAGIPADVLEHIFDPFYTTKGREAGSGLGLSISQRIIEEHDGVITVDSEPGRGTVFTINLPVHRGQDR